jgi:hypothetical protein
MAFTTLSATAQLTLVELAKRKDPSGNLAVIAEVLNKDNEILTDAPWLEANDTFSHMITRRAYLPTGSYRKLNAGVALEASRTINVSETIALLETFSQCDAAIADAAPSPTAFRMGEATAFLEGLSQTLATGVIYGNSHTTPEQFTGLAPRLNDLDLNNVINAGGSGSDTTSVFIAAWGDQKCFLVYPKGSPNYGIAHQDLGLKEVDVSTTAGTHSLMMAYRDHFIVKVGMAVKDNRYIGRIANIEVTGTSNIFDPDDLITLLNEMPQRGAGAVIYCNTDIFTQMDIQAMDKSNVLYSVDTAFGVPVVKFRGFPVRKVQAITSTETVVA